MMPLRAIIALATMLLQQHVITLPAVKGAALLDSVLNSPVDRQHCEDDSQWFEVKGRLFFLLERVTKTGNMDMTFSVNTLTRGVSPQDLQRCPMGAAAVQLFLQLGLAMSDAEESLRTLARNAWLPADEPWEDLVEVPWPSLMVSRWPIFGILDAMRNVFLGFAPPESSQCVNLWSALSEEHQRIFHDATHVGHIFAMALRFPSDSCAAARVTAAVAMLSASMSSDAAPEMKDQLMQEAQEEIDRRWPRDLLHSPWPALPLLSRVERTFVPDSLRRELVGELRGAIAYIHFNPKDMARFHDIEQSLASLQQFWLDGAETKWPVFVFVDPESAPKQTAALKSKFPDLDLRIAIMNEPDLSWPIPHDHPSCSPGYRRAARFTAGPLYMHEALNSITHLFVIDTEFVLTHPVPWDPLMHFYEQRGQVGFWQAHYERTWNRTMYLTEVSREYMASHGLKPQIPELVQYWWDIDEIPGGSFPVNIYGCLFAGSMKFFRSKLFQEYFHTLDSYPGWSEHCWSPQNVLAIASGFFLHDGELRELWVFGRHQSSSKTPKEGWNDSKKGLLSLASLSSSDSHHSE